MARSGPSVLVSLEAALASDAEAPVGTRTELQARARARAPLPALLLTNQGAQQNRVAKKVRTDLPYAPRFRPPPGLLPPQSLDELPVLGSAEWDCPWASDCSTTDVSEPLSPQDFLVDLVEVGQEIAEAATDVDILSPACLPVPHGPHRVESFRPPPGLSRPQEWKVEESHVMAPMDRTHPSGLAASPAGALQVEPPCESIALTSDIVPPPPLPFQDRYLPAYVPQPAAAYLPQQAVAYAPEITGSKKFFSVGSAYHHMGHCRPCDFVARDDPCREGAACKFCHLCGPEDLKAKRKLRKKMARAQMRWEAGM